MIPDHIMIGDSSSHLNRYLSENNYSKICILVDENTHSNCLKKLREILISIMIFLKLIREKRKESCNML